MVEAMAQQDAATEEGYVFEFKDGIYGFPEAKRFAVRDIPGGGDAFKQMLSVEELDLGFTLLHPFSFFSDYTPEIPDEEARELGAEAPDQLVVMVIANVATNVKETTVNLKAPLIFNPYTRKACQVILSDERYLTRHRVFKG